MKPSNWSMHQVQLTITDGVVVAREYMCGRENYCIVRFRKPEDVIKGMQSAVAALAIEPLDSSYGFGTWRWNGQDI